MATLVLFGHDLSGPTSARPANAEIGQNFFDTTTGQLLVWNGTVWQAAGATSTAGKFLAISADTTLTVANAGQVVLVSKLASAKVTLPVSSAVPGMEITVVNALATTSSIGTNVAPGNGTDLIIGNGITPAATKAFINTEATNKIGDMVRMQSDGAGNWWILGVVGTWARAA